MRGLPGAIQIGGEIIDAVVRRELDSADQTIAVIEGRENDRRAELPLIDQVLRLLVETIQAECQRFVKKLLLHPKIIVMGAFSLRRVVESIGARWQGGRAREL